MKFICSQAELSIALGTVGRAISARPSHPILTTVLIDAATGRLQLTGYDLAIGIQSSIIADVSTSGQCAVSLKLFENIIAKMPKDSPIAIEVNGNEMQITTASGSYKLTTQNPEDYPDFPSVDAQSIEINSSCLNSAIKTIVYAVSDDESKQLLTGACFTFKPNQLELAATDGHRLAIKTIQTDIDTTEPFNLIIPSRALRELQRLIAEQPGESINLIQAKGQALFMVGTQKLTTRLLEGRYPDYRQLIPASFKTTAIIDCKQFIKALERVGVIAEQSTNVVRVSFNEERITITADVQDIGVGNESIPLVENNNPVDVAFNVRYLLESLKSFATEKICFTANMPTTPCVITPVNSDSEQTGQTALIMPVQVRL